MKALGVIGVIAGGLLVGIGGVCLVVIGAIALTPLLIGLIAILCGAICIALDGVHSRLRTLESKLSKTENMIRSQQPTTAESAAEETVDQLRREGLIGSAATATEKDIDEMIE